MVHIIIVTTPPSGSLVAPAFDIKVDVAYAPSHDLTPEQQSHNIAKIERLSARFYAKLQERLAAPGDE